MQDLIRKNEERQLEMGDYGNFVYATPLKLVETMNVSFTIRYRLRSGKEIDLTRFVYADPAKYVDLKSFE